MAMTQLPLALTLGDPAGIAPDITLLAWQARDREAVPAFVFVGDPAMLAARADLLGLKVPIEPIARPRDAALRFSKALPVLPLPVAHAVVPGRPDAANAAAVQQSIEQAVSLVHAGEARAVITNPIGKSVLYGAGFNFPGHTEYLASLAATRGAPPPHPVMMLVAKELKVVPATIHIPLKDVAGKLSRELIVTTLVTTASGLERYFGLNRPRLAVTGLNPHAGEDGGLGREEIEIIRPAVEAARHQGLTVTGPHPADTLFHAEARSAYDAVVAMYHDQALIPFKTIAFDHGVNVTLGLPFVRTSPDHGTAFAIAGTGQANPRSLIEALRLADTMAARAEAYV
jgi:4-hydroxythreonine-4-phosphate dehydrogenase